MQLYIRQNIQTPKLKVVIQYTNRVALQIRMYTHLKINCINNGHCVLTHKTQFLSRVGRVTPVRLGLGGWVTCEEGVETSLPAVGAEVSCRRLLKLLANDTSDISYLHFYICCTNCGYHFQNTRTQISFGLPFKVLGNIICATMASRIKIPVLLVPNTQVINFSLGQFGI